MNEIDQQFVEFVVKSLVGKPDAVQVQRSVDEKGVLLELTVDPEDLGRVIGKRGATAQSLRTLLRALGTKNDARYNLKIVDNGVGKPAGQDDKNDNSGQPAPSSGAHGADDAQAGDENTSTSKITDEEPATPAQANPQDEEDDADEDDAASDRLRKTREELADLDDLDV
jgi:predicted RNA-binding protein YlqC (UPF0109 family)